MRLKKYRSDKGFTLIELLVSVAILALVASVIYASLSKIKYDTYSTKAKVDANLIKNSIDLYYREQGDWPPFNTYNAYTTIPGGNWDTFLTLIGLPSNVLPAYPSTQSGGNINTGYVYAVANGTTGWILYAGKCLLLTDGYFLDFMLPRQTSSSINDGGIDLWGIEYFDGQFTILTVPPSQCHF